MCSGIEHSCIRNVALLGGEAGRRGIQRVLEGSIHSSDRPAFSLSNTIERLNVVQVPSDLPAEIISTLRLVDGAVLVVDVFDEVQVKQGHRLLCYALAEGVEPVLFLEGLERIFTKVSEARRSAYTRLAAVVSSFNHILSSFTTTSSQPREQHPMLELNPSSQSPSVIFGSSLHEWGFTLRQFAARYASRTSVSFEKMLERLWSSAGFDKYVLEPIQRIYDAKEDAAELQRLLEKLEISVPQQGFMDHPQEVALQAFLPLQKTIVETVVQHIPPRSPDPSFPDTTEDDLVVYASQIVRGSWLGAPNPETLCALARVVSGTLRVGEKIRLFSMGNSTDACDALLGMEPRELRRRPGHLLTVGELLALDGTPIPDGVCPAGNLVYIPDIERAVVAQERQYSPGHTGFCGITAPQSPHLEYLSSTDAQIRFGLPPTSTPPIIHVSVEPQSPADLPQLVEALKALSLVFPRTQVRVNEIGEHTICGADEEVVREAIEILQRSRQVELVVSKPRVSYRETVTAPSSAVPLSRSPNRKQRVRAVADPLDDDTLALLQSPIHHFDPAFADQSVEIGQKKQSIARRLQVDAFSKIWQFSPDYTNVFVNTCDDVPSFDALKQAAHSSFGWVVREGVLAEEPMRGVKIALLDYVVDTNQSGVLRRNGQMIPLIRRVLYAACLLAQPALQEPMYILDVPASLQAYHDQLDLPGLVPVDGDHQTRLKFRIPARECLGLVSRIQGEHGDARVELSFAGWQTLDGSPLEAGTESARVVRELRQRKGMKLSIPDLRDKNTSCTVPAVAPSVRTLVQTRTRTPTPLFAARPALIAFGGP
uniref:Eukaryotic translation elongation factor 2 n=1 Tax=Mycena chlorophos TaxID=658473 RepID=A0ABQ0M8C0_MYCCL|nr:eukaryotic translation elongation factor 2 [Mycena chlorophos]